VTATDPHGSPGAETGAGHNAHRYDPATGLSLTDPFPEYMRCPQCGEAEVEVWCYQLSVKCHNCGRVIEHTPPPLCGTYPYCKRASASGAVQDPPGVQERED
jgi:hypothetical protein